MPVVTVYQHGVTAGIPGGNKGKAGIKGEAQGWSHQATKGNLRFLRSVTLSELTGVGFAITLTLKDCPPSHDLWAALRRSYMMRLSRAGMVRCHWVTEWQRRGVPHLHGCAYFPDNITHREFANINRILVSAWCAVAAEYGALPHAQFIKPVDNSLGWFQYVAKHTARGVTHYQRSSESIPTGWKKTGRMWGRIGDWPTRDAIRLELSKPGFFALRRIVQKWRLADAKASGNSYRIQTAKKMLQGKDRTICEVRGTSEWMPETLTMQVIHHLAAQGHSVAS